MARAARIKTRRRLAANGPVMGSTLYVSSWYRGVSWGLSQESLNLAELSAQAWRRRRAASSRPTAPRPQRMKDEGSGVYAWIAMASART